MTDQSLFRLTRATYC